MKQLAEYIQNQVYSLRFSGEWPVVWCDDRVPEDRYDDDDDDDDDDCYYDYDYYDYCCCYYYYYYHFGYYYYN